VDSTFYRAPQGVPIWRPITTTPTARMTAIAGVSLTIAELAGDTFAVALVQHTLDVTTLGTLRPGDEVRSRPIDEIQHVLVGRRAAVPCLQRA